MAKAKAGTAAARPAAKPRWRFEGDYFTACNCDWGCPCSFNARPTQGNCVGWGVCRIERGQFEGTKLDGGLFALYYAFPGLIEQGNGTARLYVDSRLPKAQQQALERIGSGDAGGGLFELFAKQLTKTFLPTKFVPITGPWTRRAGATSAWRASPRPRASCCTTPTARPSSPTSTCPTASSTSGPS